MKKDRSRFRSATARRPDSIRLRIEVLEDRSMLTVPALPVIIEPLTNGQIISRFDIHMEVDPNAFFDADGDTHKATNWQIRETTANGGAVVWQALNITDPLSKVHIHQGDGTFVGTLAGQTALTRDHAYTLNVSFVDSRSETSGTSVRSFVTANDINPVPGEGTWIPHEGYKVELVSPAGAFRLPVNITFVPNPGTAPNSPFYYVSELYGSIELVTRDGQVSTYATGLLDYNPSGPISGAGEQGLTGLAIDPATGDLFVGMLWNNGTTATQRGGATLHYPKVERLHSTDGGHTMASRTILLNMQPETQGQSHQISNISIGPDNKLYVHMGDAFDSSTALDLNQYRGKILRMNLDGTAASDSPFYNAADGITAKDYVYTYGHRNPFGGAWRALDGVHYVVEDGNAVDRLVAVSSGQSYGWAGDDAALVNNSNYIWQPANAVVNIAIVQPQTFGGSLFPAGSQNDAFVALSGPTYSAGPQETGKRIAWFPDLDSRGADGKLTAQPITLVQYNGTGRSTVVGLAAGPDGLYFTDFYRDDGVGGATATGANVYRVRYVDFHPTDLAATAGNAQVSLNWSTDPLATTYNIYRATGSGTAVLIKSNLVGGSFTDTSATNGTLYQYLVRGVNAGGESEDSNNVAATPSGSAGQPPTVAVAASASPSPIVGTTTNLSVLGSDDGGEANLIYTWALQGTPPAAVGFSENGTNAAKNSIATFIAAGAYTFDVTIRDGANQTVHSSVTVTVNQTLTSVTVSPTTANVATNGTQQFTASALDQFTRPLATQPTITWNIASGVGAINATGLYQAPSAAGSATVRATTGTTSATAAVTVTAAAARQGLTAIYYNNADLTGTSFIRNDAAVNFDFALGSPSSFIASDTFSARWIGFIVPLYSQTYTFITTSDDGVRLWVNNQQIINQWNDHAATQHTGTIALVAGTRYDIRLEFYDNTEEAVIKLEWQSTSQARQIVPQSQLFSTLPITINFQPSSAAVPSGYLVDGGAAFGDRGNGYSYGWNGNNASTAIDRNSTNSPDQRYDTFMQMQQAALPNAAWEIAVPNGLYRVHVVSGDPTSNSSVYKVNVEGVLAVNGTPTNSKRWIEGWVDVTVSDGRLSITNATGATNNKINLVDIIL